VALLEEGRGAPEAGTAGAACRLGDGRCGERRTAWSDLLPGKAGALAIDNTRCSLECVFWESV